MKNNIIVRIIFSMAVITSGSVYTAVDSYTIIIAFNPPSFSFGKKEACMEAVYTCIEYIAS